MEQKAILYVILGVLGGIVLTVFYTSTVVNNNNLGMMRMMGINSQNKVTPNNSNTIDAHFIEQMIPHHEDAITMAKLAQTKAQRPEVKQLAENIISSQEAENKQMKEWYKEWFGKDVPEGNTVMNQHGMMGQNGMHMGMMGNDTDITSLEESEDFDREFVEHMIPHHQMAVMMANMLKGGTQRPEMKQLADEIIEAQTNEIDQMRQWYVDWGYSQ